MQKIDFGIGSSLNIEQYLKKYYVKNVFLVHGKKSFYESGISDVISDLLNKYSFTSFSDFTSNPKIEDVKKGIDLYRSRKFDIIIAIGGGSAMDIAKLIKGLAKSDEDLESHIKNNHHIQNNIPFIAVPTTCGSGSESTHFAVVYINGIKYSFANKNLLPNYALIDGHLSVSGSNYLKACSGLDALCQSIESHWSVNSTKESRGFSLLAMDKLINNLKEFISSPSVNSINEISLASNLAGRAINISKTTAPHALSYSITSNYGIPHGHAVALGMPYFIKYNSDFSLKNLNKGIDKRALQNRLTEIFNCFGASDAKQCSEVFTNLVQDIGINMNILKNKINKSELKEIVDNLNNQRAKNNPRKVNNNHLIDNFLEI